MRHSYIHSLTDGGNGRDDLSQLQLVQDGGLTSCVQTDLVCSCTIKRVGLWVPAWHIEVFQMLLMSTHHENSHLLLDAKQAVERLGKGESHVCCLMCTSRAGVVECSGLC